MENEGSGGPAERAPAVARRRLAREVVIGASMPLLLCLFAVRIGSFSGGAAWSSVVTAFVLAVCVAVAGAWRAGLDPLGFSGIWRRRGPVDAGPGSRSSGPNRRHAVQLLALSPFLVVGLVGVSHLMSPVPRAGLLWPPAMLLGLLAIPAVASTLDRPERRCAARWVVAGSLLIVSVWALVDWLGGSPRPAAPLGHHNLLAAWLVVLWPLALLPGRIPVRSEAVAGSLLTPRPVTPMRRVVDGAVLAAAALALLASRSLAGNLAFGAQLVFIARASPAPGRSRRLFHFGLLGIAMVLAVAWRRLGSVFSGGLDSSFAARWDYAGAALSGWLERPLWGWGPGSSAWTLHLHLDGSRLAPGEVVTDAHALALDLLYEWGLVALLAGALLVAWVWWSRAGDSPADGASGDGWRGASTTSLVGCAVLSCGAGWFDVTALWVLIPFVLGCRLAVAGSGAGRTPPATSRWVAIGMIVFALWPVLGPLRAHRLQEQARVVGSGSARPSAELLGQATRLDPGHPQIGMEWARSARSVEGLQEPSAGEASKDERWLASAMGAARTAKGLAPLHLEAGALFAEWSLSEPGQAPLMRWREPAVEALEAACDLAPLDALAPFLRATLESPAPGRPLLDFLTRALLADPRLLVTPELLARPDLRGAAVERVAGMEEIPVGWRAALVEAEAGLPELPTSVLAARPLELVTDGLGETSLSLFAFRRRGEPTVVAWVAVDGGRLDFDIPPVFVLPEIRTREVLGLAPGCRISEAQSGVRSGVRTVLARVGSSPAPR